MYIICMYVYIYIYIYIYIYKKDHRHSRGSKYYRLGYPAITQ